MKFLISGYYGFDNLGDEAILAVLAAELRREFPDAEIVVLSHRPAETAQRYNLRAVNRWSIRQILKELVDTTLFISGGGGLIQDRTSRRSALYYLALIRIAQRYCPVALVGQGIGPLRSFGLQILALRVLRHVRLANIRDEASQGFLKAAGLPGECIIPSGDLTFLSWPAWSAVRDRDPSTAIDQPSRFGVAISGRGSQKYRQALADQLDRVYVEMGMEPVIMTFHPMHDRPEAHAIQKLMKSPVSIVEPSAHDPSNLMGCVSQMRYMLGMRLHSLIFSLLAARPLLAITGDPKLSHLLNQIREFGGPEITSYSVSQVESGQMDLVKQLQDLERAYGSQREQLGRAGEALFSKTLAASTKTWGALRALALDPHSRE